jgi:phenylalanyl-tRNA synthetase alpha chain
MQQKLEQLKQEVLEQLNQAKDSAWLKNIEQKYFSRQGELNQVLKSLKDLSAEARKDVGQLANQVKAELTKKYQEVKNSLEGNGQKTELIDPTLPGNDQHRGHIHPLSQTQKQLEDIFTSLGFTILDGPELESEYYNFEAINIPADHPARDMQDTFYVEKPGANGQPNLVLRTHTSSVQVRSMEKYGAPLKGIIPGRVFRSEATDVRHEHTFLQLEGMIIDKNINFNHLKGILELVGQKLYGPQTKLRLRPKFYPFVEPGANGEYTCFLCQGKGCKLCKQTGWLEIVGCGLIHPEVLRAGGIDPDEYTGLAFGFGLNRLTMLQYGIDDIRLFNSGDLRFLEQF